MIIPLRRLFHPVDAYHIFDGCHLEYVLVTATTHSIGSLTITTMVCRVITVMECRVIIDSPIFTDFLTVLLDLIAN